VPSKSQKQSELNILHTHALPRIPWLIHGFSTREGGYSKPYGGSALNLGFTREDSRAAVERNRAEFLKKLKATQNRRPWPLITLRQIHSDLIHHVSEPSDTSLTGDGMITSTPGILLAIQTADCLPVILVDPKHKTVGVFHAGWRGTIKRIIEKGAGEMRRQFGTLPRDLQAAIGPSIHSCCYEVGPEVRADFESQFAYAGKLFREVKESDPIRQKYPMLFLTARAPGHSQLPKKIYLDLVEANRLQLLAIGVLAGNIAASDLCTSCCNDRLFSYRAEKGVTGRMMGIVGIRRP
jgi:purine-nucleoside/S-methyl-5'-thioadenosine phosphorylase / adenosine deaminase